METIFSIVFGGLAIFGVVLIVVMVVAGIKVFSSRFRG